MATATAAATAMSAWAGPGAPPVRGMLGAAIVQGAPEALCRIVTRDAQGKLKTTCSGVLVAPDEMATAAHCFEGLKASDRLEAQCGYQGMQGQSRTEPTAKGNSIEVGNLSFKWKPEVASIEVAQLKGSGSGAGGGAAPAPDVARIRLKGSSRISPIPWIDVVQRSQLFTDEGRVKPPAECRVSGFGVGPGKRAGAPAWTSVDTVVDHDGQVASWLAIRIRRENVDTCRKATEALDAGRLPIRDFVEMLQKLENPPPETTNAGDSGGPLYCRASPSAPWKMLGVLSGITFQVMEEDPIGIPPTIEQTQLFGVPVKGMVYRPVARER